MKKIDSPKNPTVKKVQGYLEKSRDRKKDNVFVVEGLRENERAVASGYEPLWFFYEEGQLVENQLRDMLNNRDAMYHECHPSAFSKMAFRTGVPNAVGVFRRKPLEWGNVEFSDNPLVLVVEGVEKPGNLGAILRTASATQTEAVIVADSVVDIYHPHVMRNSLGGFFDVPVIPMSTAEAIEKLRADSISIYATYLPGAMTYHKVDWKVPVAIVVGAEDRGITQSWVEEADALIKIPMSGVVDSLNVSVAAAVVLFEAIRNRSDE